MTDSREQGHGATRSPWQPGRPVSAGRHPAPFPASYRARRRGGRCRRRQRRHRCRRHGPPPTAANAAGHGPDRDHLRPEARGDPHAGEPVLRPLLRHPQRRPRVRRQAGPHLAEREQHLPAARLGPHRPRVPAARTISPTRPTATSTTAGPATTRRATAACGTTGSRPRPQETMGYFTRSEIPFQYALADAFTICDGYHQAIMAPTSPNRMYFWTGTSSGWTSQPERLQGRLRLRRRDGRGHHLPGAVAGRRGQLAGLHQRPGGRQRQLPGYFLGDYGDNPLWFYQQYNTTNSRKGGTGTLATRGAVTQWADRQGRARPEPDACRLRAVLVHRRRQEQHPAPGVLDRRAGGLLRAPVLHPRLRRPLREHRPPDAVREPRRVEQHGTVRHLRRA